MPYSTKQAKAHYIAGKKTKNKIVLEPTDGQGPTAIESVYVSKWWIEQGETMHGFIITVTRIERASELDGGTILAVEGEPK
jgi:hypothetical protein